MDEKFSIQSTHTDRQLIFSAHDGEYFRVEIQGGIRASIRVYNYAPHAQELARWFDGLGKYKAPWDGEVEWHSLEGELRILASCDNLGHVRFMIYLSDMMGSNEESYIQAGIESELGQLEGIANGARRFFAE